MSDLSWRPAKPATDWLDPRIDTRTVSADTVTSATPACDDPAVVPIRAAELLR